MELNDPERDLIADFLPDEETIRHALKTVRTLTGQIEEEIDPYFADKQVSDDEIATGQASLSGGLTITALTIGQLQQQLRAWLLMRPEDFSKSSIGFSNTSS